MWWRHWPRWVRRLVLASIGAFFLLFVAGIGVLYAATKVPLPEQVNVSQTSVITYADNTHEVAKIGAVNRTSVPLSSVSKDAQHAVLAAEDRNFYHEPGISYRGIGRALWTDVRGGEISQGGSTITQQYAKNAYLTQQRTFTRKIREIALAVKLDKKYSKDQILEFYLNTIYFGRDSYGIEAASETYFGVPASHLTAAQGAVLAGLIRSPNQLDPQVSPRSAERRWHEVVNTMVSQKWLTASQAAAMKVPATQSRKAAGTGSLNPQQIYLRAAVEHELTTHGISEDQINLEGLRIVTTLDYARQTNAYLAVTNTLKGQTGLVPPLQTGLVAVEPGTGKILAWYGGDRYDSTDKKDNVTSAVPPGSSFKPVVLATALAKGMSLNSYYDAPDRIPSFEGKELRNDETNANFGKVNLIKATAESINTVYVPLAQDVGPRNMVDMAHKLGIPQTRSLEVDARQALGKVPVSALDMTSVYGTFASGGYEATPHLVDKVIDRHGKVIYSPDADSHQVLTSDQTADLTYALQSVITEGTGTAAALAGGRPAAGKTGTMDDFRSAWFCGYTPQLASCVDMFRGQGGTKATDELTGVPGVPGEHVYGGTLPAAVWKAFMDAALSGQPQKQFPAPAYGGTVDQSAHASPAPPPPPPVTPSAEPTRPNPAPTHKRRATPIPTAATPTEPTVTPTYGTITPPWQQLPLPGGGNGGGNGNGNGNGVGINPVG